MNSSLDHFRRSTHGSRHNRDASSQRFQDHHGQPLGERGIDQQIAVRKEPLYIAPEAGQDKVILQTMRLDQAGQF